MRRLGHEPVAFTGGDVDHTGIDAAVIEPGEAAALRVARNLRAKDVPVLFTSIYPADAEVLDLQPAAYLVKPFPLFALERALELALAVRASAPAVAAL
ncbi:MAG: hypothetical protein QOH95_525 [Gaiellaceae bacterium]|nr:hypothetical protein [Gaiellaceae bacterium]